MATAVLTCFHGPVVESSFSLMGDSTDKRSGRMFMATFSAFETCKYAIRSTGKSSLQMFNRQDILRDVVNRSLILNMRTSHASDQNKKTEKEAMKKKFHVTRAESNPSTRHRKQ